MGSSERRRLIILTALVSLPIIAYLVWSLGQVGGFRFRFPWLLLLLLAVPLSFWFLLLRRRQKATLEYSNAQLLQKLRPGLIARLSTLPNIFRVLAFSLLVVALARPQTRDRGGRVEVEGIDIVVTLDMSRSMEAIDLAPNRLEAAKKVIDQFVARRKSDRIGLVVFGREAFTHCPLTLDYSVLRNMINDLHLGLIDGSATAIGNAIGVSLARLRNSDAKSRVVILLTDGDSNSGNVSPTQAARYAQAMNVKVFTILMGPREGAPVTNRRDIWGRPVPAPYQYPVNPKLLQEIADQTGGKAYQATDRVALEKNFESILNELDKSTRKDVGAIFNDAFRPFVTLALLLLLAEAAFRLTRLRHFP
jgi:Ca-activated chloride channel family protein